jgi:hypothetical protein
VVQLQVGRLERHQVVLAGAGIKVACNTTHCHTLITVITHRLLLLHIDYCYYFGHLGNQ